jgi:VanZ family protein
MRDRSLISLWLPVGLWCAMIFALSSIPNLRFFQESVTDFVFRKIGHMFEYAVLARLLLRALQGTTRWPARRIFVLALSLTIVYAMTDEAHQRFVRGRVGHPQDVAIDAAGAAIGLVIAR